MAGTFTPKFLADGQLANIEADIYVSVGTKTLVKTIILVNTSAVDRQVNIFVKRNGGVSRRIYPVDFPLGAHDRDLLMFNVILESNDALRGYADLAAAVDFSIFGVLET